MLKLTALIDNLSSEHKGLIAEHGLSIWVELDDTKFLFDCGAKDTVIKNAFTLGIDLELSQFTVCSHSHYDHSGGFKCLVEENIAPSYLYTGEGFLDRKYAFDGLKYTDLSCGFEKDYIEKHSIYHRIISDYSEILPGVYVFGNFDREFTFETIPNRFVKGNDFVIDDFSDEICLAFDTKDGVVMLVGCSHPGILNMTKKVYETLNKPIYAILGGTHLVEADNERIETTLKYMKDMGVKILGFSHCTGEKAESCVKQENDFLSCHLAVGDSVIFDT